MTDYNKTIKETFAKPKQNNSHDEATNDHQRFIDDYLNTIINADDEQAARRVLMDIIKDVMSGQFKQTIKDGI